jgi:hypothetical protein
MDEESTRITERSEPIFIANLVVLSDLFRTQRRIEFGLQQQGLSYEGRSLKRSSVLMQSLSGS